MNSNHKLKIIIISSLCLVLIIMLYFYLSGKGSSSNDNSETKTSNEITNERISKDLDSIFVTFGIRKEWIREITAKDSKRKVSASGITKEVRIPLDLPAVELNYELTNYFRSIGLNSRVNEDPRTKNISMDIFKRTIQEKDSTLQAVGTLKLNYTDSIRRDASEICIILDSLDSYNLDDVEKILSSPQEFSVFLPLRNDKADYQSKISDLKRDYLIKLSTGDENDIETDFKSDMKESLWKSKVKSLYLNFPSVSSLILTSKAGLKDFEEDLIREFEKNNLNVYKDTLLTRIIGDANKVNRMFEDIILRSKNGKKYLIYAINFNPAEYSDFESRVHTLKKLGYKFFNFMELMKHRNKIDRVETAKIDSVKVEKKK